MIFVCGIDGLGGLAVGGGGSVCHFMGMLQGSRQNEPFAHFFDG